MNRDLQPLRAGDETSTEQLGLQAVDRPDPVGGFVSAPGGKDPQAASRYLHVGPYSKK
jgi:hypothetical protein